MDEWPDDNVVLISIISIFLTCNSLLFFELFLKWAVVKWGKVKKTTEFEDKFSRQSDQRTLKHRSLVKLGDCKVLTGQ